MTIPVRWMPVREFPLDDPRTWESLASEVRGFCLIAGVQAVFSKGFIEHLRQSVRDGEALVVTREAGPVEPAVGRRNPAVALQEGRLISFHNHPAAGRPSGRCRFGGVAGQYFEPTERSC